MVHGATLKLTMTFAPETRIDIQWDDAGLSDPEPKGNWGADSSFLGGLTINRGEWEWDPADQELGLLGMVETSSGLSMHLLVLLEQFTFPVTRGMTGPGRVVLQILPTTEALTFTWEATTAQ